MNEEHSYTVHSDFYLRSSVDDIELSISPNGLTRKVLRAELIDNPKRPADGVRICVVHQKRKQQSDDWTDESTTSLKQTSYSKPSKFPLDTAETRRLFDHLCDLYRISKDGIHRGKEVVHIADPDEWIRTDAPRARMIDSLLKSNHGEEIWQTLVELQPDLADQLARALVHKKRLEALKQFEVAIDQARPEEWWKQLLRDNRWIFGGGNVALIDEARIDIHNFADLPFKVEGGFMDLVELKKPDFDFWTMSRTGQPWRYRKRFLTPHPELNGAIAQMRGYILQAEKHVADSDFHKDHGVVPLKPRGLVVHGRSHTWETDEWEAYRLLNDGLHGVQVLTFDHLLEQAKRALND